MNDGRHGVVTGCRCDCTVVKFVVTVTSCFLITCTLGITYTFGNIDPYLTSYLRNVTGDLAADYTQTLWIYQTSGLVNSVALPLVGLTANLIPLKLFLLLGALFNAATFFGTYFTLGMSFWWTMLTYGFLAGVPAAFLYPTCIKISVQWLPSRTGLLTGVILMGYGAGPLVWNTLTTWYINHDNLQPDLQIGEDLYYTQSSVLQMVPRCFMLLGIIFAVIHVICILTIWQPPLATPTTLVINADQDEKAAMPGESRPLLTDDSKALADVLPSSYGACDKGPAKLINHHADQTEPRTPANPSAAGGRETDEEEAAKVEDEDEDIRPRDYTLAQACRTSVFWTLWLMSFFLQTGVAIPIALWKAYGQTFIADDHFLGVVASVSSVFNAVGRPPLGILADKIGSKVVCLCLQCALAALVATICLCQRLGPWAFLAWVCAMFLSMCGVFTMFPTILMTCFGTRHYNAIQGLLDMSGIVGSLLPTLVAPVVKSTFGWYGLFVFSFAGLFLSILLNMCLSVKWCNSIPRHLLRALDR